MDIIGLEDLRGQAVLLGVDLRQRIDAAADYLIAHPDAIAIVSGGMGPGEDVTEAACMAHSLVSAGIDSGRILLEDQATSTSENLRFSMELMD